MAAAGGWEEVKMAQKGVSGAIGQQGVQAQGVTLSRGAQLAGGSGGSAGG